MTCYNPGVATVSPTGSVVFGAHPIRAGGRWLDLPCGVCLGCRLERARQWTVRLVHEASFHRENCFVTLTYEDGRVPEGGNLRYSDFQEFIRCLRKLSGCFDPKGVWVPYPLRFFMSGEYGGESGRPHYHALLFGLDFPDRKLFSSAGKFPLFTSKVLASVWPHGFGTVGSVDPGSCGYVAQYCVKKLGSRELGDRVPEFCRMSLKPGIGRSWIDKHLAELSDLEGEVVMEGRKFRAPRYYDKVMEDEAPLVFARYRAKRILESERKFDDNVPKRLRVKAEVTAARFRRD